MSRLSAASPVLETKKKKKTPRPSQEKSAVAEKKENKKNTVTCRVSRPNRRAAWRDDEHRSHSVTICSRDTMTMNHGTHTPRRTTHTHHARPTGGLVLSSRVIRGEVHYLFPRTQTDRRDGATRARGKPVVVVVVVVARMASPFDRVCVCVFGFHVPRLDILTSCCWSAATP